MHRVYTTALHLSWCTIRKHGCLCGKEGKCFCTIRRPLPSFIVLFPSQRQEGSADGREGQCKPSFNKTPTMMDEIMQSEQIWRCPKSIDLAGNLPLSPELGGSYLRNSYEVSVQPAEQDPDFLLKQDLLVCSSLGFTHHIGHSVRLVGIFQELPGTS